MPDGSRSPRRAVVLAILGALFTAVLWTALTGEVERGALYGGIVLVVLLAGALIEHQRDR
jgi:hypothetical protein